MTTDQGLRRLKYLIVDGVVFPPEVASLEQLHEWVRENGYVLEEARRFIIELLLEVKHDLTEG